MFINLIVAMLIATGTVAIFLLCRSKTKVLYENKSKDILIYEKNSKRFMIFQSHHKVIQSAYDCAQPLKIVLSYQKLIVSCATLLPHPPQKIAIIGLGGGNLTIQLRRLYPQAFITHFEKEERMLDYARRYFQLRVDNNMDFIWGDAHEQLKLYSQASDLPGFDLIVLDAFEGARPVSSFSTQNFCYTLLRVLSPTGVALINSLSHGVDINKERAVYINVFDYVSECSSACLLERNYIRWVGHQSPGAPNLKNFFHILKLQGLTEQFIEAVHHSLSYNMLQRAPKKT